MPLHIQSCSCKCGSAPIQSCSATEHKKHVILLQLPARSLLVKAGTHIGHLAWPRRDASFCDVTSLRLFTTPAQRLPYLVASVFWLEFHPMITAYTGKWVESVQGVGCVHHRLYLVWGA